MKTTLTFSISRRELQPGSKMIYQGREVEVIKQRPLKHFTTINDNGFEREVRTEQLTDKK